MAEPRDPDAEEPMDYTPLGRRKRLYYVIRETRFSRHHGFYRVEHRIPVRYLMICLVLLAVLVVVHRG